VVHRVFMRALLARMGCGATRVLGKRFPAVF